MFATIRETHALFQSLVSGPNDLPPGLGPYGAPVDHGDVWGDYTAVGLGSPGKLPAPESDGEHYLHLECNRNVDLRSANLTKLILLFSRQVVMNSNWCGLGQCKNLK